VANPLPKELCAGSWLAWATLFLLSLAGCSKPASVSPALKIDHQITPQPVQVGRATVDLRVTTVHEQPIAGAHIALEADMSHAGMSPVFGEAKEIEPGRYRAQLDFGMAGDWVILLHIVLPGGGKLDRQIDVRGVRPNQAGS
jgi:hypothetical protein